jgi:hypothetical protein
MITLSVEGFKFSALANGGACVALLAYLETVASKGAATPDMRLPMGAILAGLVSCGAAMLCAYVTQLTLFREERDGKTKWRWHQLFLWLSVAFYATSIAAFAVGAWWAVRRF